VTEPIRSAKPTEQASLAPIRIAISANFTAEPIAAVLGLWARELQCEFAVSFAPYNQIQQTLLDPGSEFARNQHGVNVVLCRYEDLGQFEKYDAAALAQLRDNLVELASALREAPARMGAPVLVCLCPASPGFLADPQCAVSQAQARQILAQTLRGVAGVQTLSDEELRQLYPVEQWHDAEADKLGRIPYTELGFAALGTAVVRRAQALFMPPYKVIAVDCDNTLWRGICGEDGPAGVVLDAPRRQLHEFLLEQREAGMLLVLASKNNEQDVFDTFAAHPEFPLQLHHFTAWRLNWESKAMNLASLSEELNAGLDTFIFLDDNPKECAEVTDGAPEVLPLVLPEDLDDLPEFLRHVWAFDHPVVTEEDRQRSAMIGQSLEFGREIRQAASLEEFIAGLNLRVDFQPLSPERVGRVAQLTQRTNQFNTTTIRRSESDIQSLVADQRHRVFTAEVSDRFGEYGLVGVLVVETRPQELRVDAFLLSCRALGRGVEHRMLSALAEEALDQGIYYVAVEYRPTARNMPARQFLDSIGFGERREVDGGYAYVFAARELQALRWKPSREEAVPAAKRSRPKSQTARRFVEFERIALRLRRPEQVVGAIRRLAQTSMQKSNAPDAPRTEVEQGLARIWTELLGRPVVSTSANFFDLGGHSLLAVLLLMRVKEEFGLELSVDDVYSGSLTLGELARTLEARQLGAIDPEEYQAMLAEIEGLSDEEVRALLEREAEIDPEGLR
jgi:FkbH-like protein